MRVLIHLSSFLVFFLCSFFGLHAQACGCDVTLTQSGYYRPSSQGTGTFYLNVLPGQTICLQAGQYDRFTFVDFVGTPSAPITIKNCGGLVEVNHSSNYSAIGFRGCKYIHVTGTGSSDLYGIKIGSSGVETAFSIAGLSTDFEVDHVEIGGAGFAGIMAKSDPSCDTATWRSNFVMRNVNLHHNYIHNVTAEGFYVGHGAYATGVNLTCSGQSVTAFPHLIENLQIHHNILKDCGAECIQYACAPNALVYNNYSEGCGFSPFGPYQCNGIQVGGGAGGACYNNTVRNVNCQGIIILGHLGDNSFYNNLVINSGSDGFFIDNYSGTIAGTYCNFINNTVINPGRDGIRLYNETNVNRVINNVFIVPAPNVYHYLLSGTTATFTNNYEQRTIPAGLFSSTTNYFPAVGSPLENTGTDVSSYGVTTDMSGLPRPQGGAFDIGVHETTTVLPLALKSFEAKAHILGAALSWETASEFQTQAFQIERAEGNAVFETIRTVPAQNKASKYDYLDVARPLGLSYYRLKMMDSDGFYTYSPVRALASLSGFDGRIENGQLVLSKKQENTYLRIQISDIMGREFLNESSIETQFDLKKYGTGQYIIRVESPSESKSWQVTVL